MAIFECARDGISKEHEHDFDEYFVVIQGEYTLGIDGKKIPLTAGQEYFIQKKKPHDGRFIAGTRTIHAFGGKRADRALKFLGSDLMSTAQNRGITILSTKDAIEQRRSIRKFKPDLVPNEHIAAILDAARLAPSGCNAQPWRFKVVKDVETKLRLKRAAFNQSFIAEAPVVIVCCADVKAYMESTVSGLQDLGELGSVEERISTSILEKANKMKNLTAAQLGEQIALNVAIAIEHAVLRALDFGLGTCWVRLVDRQMIREIFDWNDNLYVVALLPVGYSAESPEARRRLKLEEILIE
jgi:nitroreductase